jgi:hypothetical protein
VLAREESADAWDHAHHFVSSRRWGREYLVEQVCDLDLIRIAEQFGV